MDARGHKAKGATPLKSIAPFKHGNYRLDLPALFAFAHLAFIAAESALLHAALLFLFGFSTGCSGSAATFAPFPSPCRPSCFGSNTMFAGPPQLTFLLFLLPFSGFAGASGAAGDAVVTGAGISPPPRIAFSSSCSASICSLTLAAFRSCCGVKASNVHTGAFQLLGAQNRVLGCLGDTELHNALGGNLDGLARGWISAHASLAIHQHQLA